MGSLVGFVGLSDNDSAEGWLCGINSVNVVYPPLSQTASTYAIPSSVNSLMGSIL